MAFLLNTIYFSSPGTAKHNANNCLHHSGHTSFPHGVHESLVVECSLMRVLLYGCHHIFTSAFTSWLTGAFDLDISLPPLNTDCLNLCRPNRSIIRTTHLLLRTVSFALEEKGYEICLCSNE